MDLPNLETFTTGKDSFYKTRMFVINRITTQIYNYSDVPFINGEYIHGEKTFYTLFSNHIQYDEGIVLI